MDIVDVQIFHTCLMIFANQFDISIKKDSDSEIGGRKQKGKLMNVDIKMGICHIRKNDLIDIDIEMNI